jgi:hypothetical protein
MKALVLVSGGVDSTAALFEVLNRDHFATLDVVHVQVRRGDMRWVPALYAARRITFAAKEMFPKAVISFYSPVITFPKSYRLQIPEIFFYRTVAGCLAIRKDGAYKFIVNGATKDDDDEHGIDTSEFGDGYAEGKTKRFDLGRILTNALSEYSGKKIEMWRPVVAMTKKEAADSLPEEVRRMTWSCFGFKEQAGQTSFQPCRECRICSDRVHAGILLENLDVSDDPAVMAAIKAHEAEMNMFEEL